MLNDLLAKNQSSDKLYVEDVFSTWLYTGNNTTNTITNGINLSGKGGLVWLKARASETYGANIFVDTARGRASLIASSNTATTNATDAAYTSPSNTDLVSFNSNGFTLGGDNWFNKNTTNAPYASWTFRKAPKFFDVVTYTGNSANRTISHGLGSVPGMIIVKRTDTTGDWFVYHRSLSNTQYLRLNMTNQVATSTAAWNSTTPTSTEFSLGDSALNISGGSYVAYLFAHDTTTDGVIQCGSYTGNSSTAGPDINLGWEPQFLLIKNASASYNWVLFDNMRGGFGAPSSSVYAANLYPNTSDAEVNGFSAGVTASGFKITDTAGQLNSSGSTYIYLAIRRGPMRVPTDATKVFMPTVYTGTNVDNRLVDTTIAPDTVWIRQRNSTTVGGMVVGDRLRGQPYLLTGTTAAEVNDADSFDQQLVNAVEYGTAFSSMNGVWVGNDATSQLNASTTASNQIVEGFKRAPGFFDVVCYTGTSTTNQQVTHSLGKTPELIICKRRDNISSWCVYVSALGRNKYLVLDSNSVGGTYTNIWGSSDPTSTTFNVDSTDLGLEGSIVSYLFASCPGVSKVGSYTGTGTTLQINCGFTNGARFVLIKRTDSTGDWYVYDSARGIVSGNDPYLLLNSTAAEVTNTDYIDPLSTGFELSSTAPAGLNANGGTYIYLAIA